MTKSIKPLDTDTLTDASTVSETIREYELLQQVTVHVYDPAASSNDFNLVKTITAENSLKPPGDNAAKQWKKLALVDHTDQECEPTKSELTPTEPPR